MVKIDDEKRKEILKGLVLSEEDTLKKFEELINKSRKLFAIDGKTNKIVFESINFQNPERITLFLIGKYFAKEIGLSQDYRFTTRQISDGLGIKITTLGSPLGKLVSSGYISQDGDKYTINHYKIQDILDSLILKYQEYEKKIKPGLLLGSSVKVSKNKNGKEKKTKTKKNKLSFPKIPIQAINVTVNPSGISDLAKDLEVSEGLVSQIFEFEDKEIHLLRKKHFDKESDENFHNSIIFLTGYYYHFDKREISGRMLLKYLSQANVSVGAHFKRDISRKERRTFILNKGSDYKITENGIKFGLKLLREMIR